MTQATEQRTAMARQVPKGHIQKSFHITDANAKWLYDQAYVQKATQTALVNRAIELSRALSEGRIQDVLGHQGTGGAPGAGEDGAPD